LTIIIKTIFLEHLEYAVLNKGSEEMMILIDDQNMFSNEKQVKTIQALQRF